MSLVGDTRNILTMCRAYTTVNNVGIFWVGLFCERLQAMKPFRITESVKASRWLNHIVPDCAGPQRLHGRHINCLAWGTR